MNFFDYIRKIFKKEKQYIDITNNKRIEEPVIKNIFEENNEVIKDETIEESFIGELSEELSNIDYGTIIYANRYENEEEMKKIPIGHRKGPYLVVGKNDKYLLCFMGTSVVPERNRKYRYLDVVKEYYGMKKETYFHLNNIVYINDARFKNIIENLDEVDLEKLNKHLNILNNRDYYKNKEDNIRIDKVTYQCGDIILYRGKLYFIYEINNEYLKCIELTKKYVENGFKEDGLYYNLDCFIEINKNSNIKLMNYITGDSLNKIIENIKEYFDSLNNKKIVQRGSLVKYNDEFYYIYGEEGNSWLLFKVYIDNNDDLDVLNISNKVFYTDYNYNIKLDKNLNFKNYLLATEEEMNIIKENKKHFKKSNEYKKYLEEKNKRKSYYSNPYFKPGVIVMAKDFSREKYMILERDNDLFSCISINDLNKNKIIIRDFSSSQICTINVTLNEVKSVKSKIEYLTNFDFSDNKKIELDRGVVIKRNNSYYYIYGSKGDNWMLFELYNNFNNDCDEINIKDFVFYTDFSNLITLNKKLVDYEIVAIATEEEMDIIKKRKKSFIRKMVKVYKDIEKLPTKLSNGVVVSDKNDLSIKYVLYDYGTISCRCIGEDDLNNGIKNVKIIPTSDLVIVSDKVYNDMNALLSNTDVIKKILK